MDTTIVGELMLPTTPVGRLHISKTPTKLESISNEKDLFGSDHIPRDDDRFCSGR